MRIEIESNSKYEVSPDSYTVKIEKDKQDILNEENLEAINQALCSAFEQVFVKE
tara:strand:+ start:2395 stop:2556 length:162 start_codon:yes stop_codon:yes gene_type:complete